MVREQVEQALEQARGSVVSGAALADKLGVSRAAIWKAVAALRAEGRRIDAVHGGGYLLREEDDGLTAAAVTARLRTAALGRELRVVPVTDSTNTQVKREYGTAPHGFTLIAARQSAGRGRMGRVFSSPAGGLYMSTLLRLPLPLEQLHLITLAAAVAVCRSIETLCGVSPGIKWVNDVFMDGRKLCGILTEASVEGESGGVEFAVLGIGINLRCLDGAPPAVRQVACALEEFCTPPRRAVLAAGILDELESTLALIGENPAALLDAYRARLCMLGRTVRVTGAGAGYEAVAQGVDDDGRLRVRLSDGTVRTLSSGEISIRL